MRPLGGCLTPAARACVSQPINPTDGLIEVMAVGGSLHMAAIHTELYDAHRLAQCNHVTIHVKHDIHMQVRGPPLP